MSTATDIICLQAGLEGGGGTGSVSGDRELLRRAPPVTPQKIDLSLIRSRWAQTLAHSVSTLV